MARLVFSALKMNSQQQHNPRLATLSSVQKINFNLTPFAVILYTLHYRWITHGSQSNGQGATDDCWDGWGLRHTSFFKELQAVLQPLDCRAQRHSGSIVKGDVLQDVPPRLCSCLPDKA